MCGIYGSTITYSKPQVENKLKITAFRGPDKTDFKTYKQNSCNITLGHNRLSIIDLDSRSDQPFNYNHLHIVFNGEIYNFQELKQKLIKKGYHFKTTSDTEVICASYLEYGKDCVDHFNGMFAFVIYDQKKNLFFGARDRLGKKPFYYYHNGLSFEFASQPSSIQLYNSNLSISKKSIGYYLAWGNIPDPLTIFNEVKKLEAGHSFTYLIDIGEFKSNCYWDISTTNDNQFLGSYEDAKDKLSVLLDDAVSTRMHADVPLGVFLSGGIDSSLIASIASKNESIKVKTFSVKFEEGKFDESAYATKVAKHLQTDHNIIECHFEEGISLIEDFNKFYDEPFADASAIPSLLLSKHTKKQVTVALSGDGGDESFLGYNRYNWAQNESRLYNIPFNVRLLANKILKKAPNYKLNLIGEALKFKDANKAYFSVLNGVDISHIDSHFNYREVPEMKYLEHSNKNFLERVSDFDIKTYLNWDINTKVDRATMAFSLESRAPLLDYRIVEFANSLPTSYKYLRGNQKRILKDILYQYVPKDIFDRPKAGFAMPFETWFRTDLKEYVLSELDDESLKDIPNIDIENVKFKIKQHMDGKWNRYPLIWKLLVLKQWMKNQGKDLSVK
ncbi:MAG TPA: asparagine synthase (glutamine-hydrolyzing) [Edaphocola sp.]|nr:asparagine synthase (glutamine-hydrolyzing) [Edaphocola sp.]